MVISFLFGGMLQESMRLLTGRETSVWLWAGGIFCYIGLGFWMYYKNLYEVNKIVKKEEQKKTREDIIDN